MNAAQRATDIASLIPRPPEDIGPLRDAFSAMVDRQWTIHLATGEPGFGTGYVQSMKARFIAQMYARACYSVLLLSLDGPVPVRCPLRAFAMLPLPRSTTIRFGCLLLSKLNHLLPRALPRQLLLISALMGALDEILDDAAHLGRAAVLRLASLMTLHAPTSVLPAEQYLAELTRMIRSKETRWQSAYWDAVLVPSLYQYCLAEALAVAQTPDPKDMGHRSAGIDAAVKGMWYVIGPSIGLSRNLSRFQETRWNPQQQWMADTSLLMQMIDDWVDQDQDRSERMTPVISGVWNTHSVDDLYRGTALGLYALLTGNRIRNPVFQRLFLDLYNDYLHMAIEAMFTSVAA